MLSLCFQNQSSSTNIAIDAFLFEGPFFYFYVESVYLLPSILEANTCVNCALILTYLHICIHHITLCWQLSMRYACWKLKATAETYIFLCVASMPLLWIYCFMSNSYASLIDACLESIIHEKSLLYDSFVYSLSSSLLQIAAFISYALQ